MLVVERRKGEGAEGDESKEEGLWRSFFAESWLGLRLVTLSQEDRLQSCRQRVKGEGDDRVVLKFVVRAGRTKPVRSKERAIDEVRQLESPRVLRGFKLRHPAQALFPPGPQESRR